jgi:hypothetical protein
MVEALQRPPKGGNGDKINYSQIFAKAIGSRA